MSSEKNNCFKAREKGKKNKTQKQNKTKQRSVSNRWHGVHVHLLWMVPGGGSPCSHGCLRHLCILHCHWVKLIHSCGDKYISCLDPWELI